MKYFLYAFIWVFTIIGVIAAVALIGWLVSSGVNIIISIISGGLLMTLILGSFMYVLDNID